MIPRRLWLVLLLWALASCQNQADHSQVDNAILYVHRTTLENSLVLHCFGTDEETTLFATLDYGFVGIPQWSSRFDNIFVEVAMPLSMSFLLKVEPDKSSIVSDVLSINQPNLSANNDLVFSGIQLNFPANPDIYTLSEDNTLTKITNDAVPNTIPMWSANGDKILFATLQENEPELYDIFEYDVRDKLVQTLSSADSDDSFPKYSPDDRYLAYISNKNELVMLNNSDNSVLYNISLESDIIFFAWSPSSQQLAMALGTIKSTNLYVFDVTTQDLQQLTFMQDTRNFLPVWSPNGGKIAFQSDMTGEFKIYMMDVATKAIEPLSNREGIQEFPIWARKGKFLERLSCE